MPWHNEPIMGCWNGSQKAQILSVQRRGTKAKIRLAIDRPSVRPSISPQIISGRSEKSEKKKLAKGRTSPQGLAESGEKGKRKKKEGKKKKRALTCASPNYCFDRILLIQMLNTLNILRPGQLQELNSESADKWWTTNERRFRPINGGGGGSSRSGNGNDDDCCSSFSFSSSSFSFFSSSSSSVSSFFFFYSSSSSSPSTSFLLLLLVILHISLLTFHFLSPRLPLVFFHHTSRQIDLFARSPLSSLSLLSAAAVLFSFSSLFVVNCGGKR
uniref:Uncharacterized protein n=1 Tax=Globodera rostochiensis TaxID=31243 RepID=A0A914I3I3_GLORO